MPFVAAICSKCGSALKVDNHKDTTVCAYCGTPFVTERALGHAADVYSIENRLQNAEIFLTQHKDYTKAESLFKAITEDAPGDYRAWWGVVRACTGDLSAETVLRQGCGEAKKYVTGALNVAPAHEKDSLHKQWDDIAILLEQKKNALQAELDALTTRNISLHKIVTHPVELKSTVPAAIGYIFVFLVFALAFSMLLEMEFLRVLLSIPFIIVYAFFFFIFIFGSHGRKIEYDKKTQEIKESLSEEDRKLFDSKDIDTARALYEQNEARIRKLNQELRIIDGEYSL